MNLFNLFCPPNPPHDTVPAASASTAPESKAPCLASKILASFQSTMNLLDSSFCQETLPSPHDKLSAESATTEPESKVPCLASKAQATTDKNKSRPPSEAPHPDVLPETQLSSPHGKVPAASPTMPESKVPCLASKAQATTDKNKSHPPPEASQPVIKIQASSEKENLPFRLNPDAPEWKPSSLGKEQSSKKRKSRPPFGASHPTTKKQAGGKNTNSARGWNKGNDSKRKATNSTESVAKKHCHSSSHKSSNAHWPCLYVDVNAHLPPLAQPNAHKKF